MGCWVQGFGPVFMVCVGYLYAYLDVCVNTELNWKFEMASEQTVEAQTFFFYTV